MTMRQTLLVPELRELLQAGQMDTLRSFVVESHPGTAAELLSGLETDEIWRILLLLPTPARAEVFSNFDLDQQVELATGQNRGDMARLLEEMEPDDRADLVQRLDEKVREEILPLVARAEREDIRRLVSYEEGTAGSVMNTDYAVLTPDLTVAQATEKVRIQAPSKATIYYIYVVDNQHRLLGLVSLKKLILARPHQTVRDIMHGDVVSARVSEDQESVARKIEKYDLLAIPVVDDGNVLVGIVTYDDAADIIRQEQTEDFEKFMAIGGSHQTGEYLKSSPWSHFRRRAPWLMGLAVMGFITGTIMHNFGDTLAALMVLAFFLPMFAGTGGNVGTQSATLVVRGLAMGELHPRDVLRVLGKELRVSVMLSLALWVLTGIIVSVVIILQGSALPDGLEWFQVAAAIATAMAIQVVCSTIIGSMLPMVVSSFKLDPAIVASPAITTLVDITGLLIYFMIASRMLGA
ncbi:MAG: magnesium transporter [Planctomycetes bacterium]|jgi:magnesium transporter|nr:magnesium transporter [Planctomycetota bacterium]